MIHGDAGTEYHGVHRMQLAQFVGRGKLMGGATFFTPLAEHSPSWTLAVSVWTHAV